jgi:hypothetical protein
MRARALLLVLVASVAGTAACEIKTSSAPSARPAAGMTAPSASAEPASSTSPPPTKVE